MRRVSHHTNVADNGISLSMAQPIQNAAGRPVSVFDLVTDGLICKKTPRRSQVLFRHVNGVEQIYSGNEAVITVSRLWTIKPLFFN